jgi:hypothetical protein
VYETPSRVVNRDVESSPHFPVIEHRVLSPADAWRHAVRVAIVASALAAALGLALHKFVGVDARVILVAVASIGWIVGCHLQPAAPSRWAADSNVDDFEDLAA